MKRIFFVLLVSITAFGASAATSGDVNGDGEVNIVDVNSIISIILGGPDIYQGRADVNDDGEVTINDVNAVMTYIY